MTREQIEKWREQVMANRRYGGSVLLLSMQETDALLAAAERALLLEDVLEAAKEVVSGHSVVDVTNCPECALRAAIDRAEGA